MSGTESNTKLESIQVLRAIAAWMVVFHHFTQLMFNWDISGTSIPESVMSFTRIYMKFGVDLFFIVSGTIMYMTIMRNNNPVIFLAKRSVRIIPAYWFYTALILVISFMFPYGSFTNHNVVALIQSLFFIPHANPAGIGMFPYLTVGWTLFFEMIFYCICAITLFFNKKRWWMLTLLILLVLPKCWPYEFGSYFLKNLYIQEFAIGIFIGFVIYNNFVEKDIVAALLIIIFGMYNIYNDQSLIFSKINFGFIVFGFTLVPNFKGRIYNLFITLGNASYSTYLIHIPVLVVLYNVVGVKPEGVKLASAILIYILTIAFLSVLSFRYIEHGIFDQYLRKKISKFEDKTKVIKQKAVTQIS